MRTLNLKIDDCPNGFFFGVVVVLLKICPMVVIDPNRFISYGEAYLS